ncbi:hypothetical protein BC830DRAFT_626564 [Chytriomyces sp. MP71]|nr:hypothetical protein BC830DRAFT_626564 [Chytriomyces sp. MP71]
MPVVSRISEKRKDPLVRCKAGGCLVVTVGRRVKTAGKAIDVDFDMLRRYEFHFFCTARRMQASAVPRPSGGGLEGEMMSPKQNSDKTDMTSWLSTLWGSRRSDKDGLSMFYVHLQHVTSHYFWDQASESLQSHASGHNVGDTNIAFHLAQMGKCVVECWKSDLDARLVEDAVGERRVLRHLAMLAEADMPHGILLSILHLFTVLFQHSHAAILSLAQHEAVLEPTQRIIYLAMARIAQAHTTSIWDMEHDPVYPYCKAVVDLVVVITTQIRDLNPPLVDLFLLNKDLTDTSNLNGADEKMNRDGINIALNAMRLRPKSEVSDGQPRQAMISMLSLDEAEADEMTDVIDAQNARASEASQFQQLQHPHALYSKSNSESTLTDPSALFERVDSPDSLTDAIKRQHQQQQLNPPNSFIRFSLLEACIDLLTLQEPVSGIAQMGILSIFDIFAALDKETECETLAEEDHRVGHAEHNAIASDQVPSGVKNIRDRFSEYILQSSFFVESVFQELVLRYTATLESVNSASTQPDCNHFLSLFISIDAISGKTRHTLPAIHKRIEEGLLLDFLHVSLFQSFLRPDADLNALSLRFTNLLQAATPAGLLVPLLFYALDVRIEPLVAQEATTMPATTLCVSLINIVDADLEVLEAIMELLDIVVKTVDPFSVAVLLGTSSASVVHEKASSVAIVDRYLKIAYLGSAVPSSALIQKDLDPYFFEALDKKCHDDIGVDVPALGPLTCPDSQGVLCKLLTKLVLCLPFLNRPEALRVSGLVSAVAWKVGGGVAGFERILEVFEEFKEQVLREIGEPNLDIVMHEINLSKDAKPGGISMADLSASLKIPVPMLESARMLVEMTREVLAILLVRGVDLT